MQAKKHLHCRTGQASSGEDSASEEVVAERYHQRPPDTAAIFFPDVGDLLSRAQTCNPRFPWGSTTTTNTAQNIRVDGPPGVELTVPFRNEKEQHDFESLNSRYEKINRNTYRWLAPMSQDVGTSFDILCHSDPQLN